MEEEVFNGLSLEYLATAAEGINEYNSIRWWVDGKEVLVHNIKMVVYISKDD